MTEEQGPDQTVSLPGVEHERAVFTPHVSTSATLAWLVDGYTAARARLRAAAAPHPPDPRATFQPMFETLNWAVTIDDYARCRQKRPFDDKVLAGIRFARNRVHHQWADALEPEHLRSISSVAGSETRRRDASWWFWKPASILPRAKRRHRRGKQEYRSELEGHLVDEALDHLEALFQARLAETG